MATANDIDDSAKEGVIPEVLDPLESEQQQQASSMDAGGSSTLAASSAEHPRSQSVMSQSHTLALSRTGTLKKRQSFLRANSLKISPSVHDARSLSRKSMRTTNEEELDGNDAFYVPIPTHGNPTEVLATRFQAWRKVLKDIITYFRELQKTYEARSKTLYGLSGVLSNIAAPPGFIYQGGISDTLSTLRDYHKRGISEANKARSIQEEVVIQLTGLRNDLGQKVKEIKSLSGDFKNNVDKEMEVTRRVLHDYQRTLKSATIDTKSDPYLAKLAVERQLSRQIEEENYLHRAYLNLEGSGRELESIVVGEIQKAYTAFSIVLAKEAEEAQETVDELRIGPLNIAKDFEWNVFIDGNEQFFNPSIPLRKLNNINYSGRDDAAAAEIRDGKMERKSKYLKSYTPGWYVLTGTHLHEFKSPERVWLQTPVMSLILSEQKLGSHSNPGSSSHKFMLKGRQSGGMHKSHAWVFRAESHEMMMNWYSDIKSLTEKTGLEREVFIRKNHARVLATSSRVVSMSDKSIMDEDEADIVPFANDGLEGENPEDETEPVNGTDRNIPIITIS